MGRVSRYFDKKYSKSRADYVKYTKLISESDGLAVTLAKNIQSIQLIT